jgi:hypothetical protein
MTGSLLLYYRLRSRLHAGLNTRFPQLFFGFRNNFVRARKMLLVSGSGAFRWRESRRLAARLPERTSSKKTNGAMARASASTSARTENERQGRLRLTRAGGNESWPGNPAVKSLRAWRLLAIWAALLLITGPALAQQNRTVTCSGVLV